MRQSQLLLPAIDRMYIVNIRLHHFFRTISYRPGTLIFWNGVQKGDGLKGRSFEFWLRYLPTLKKNIETMVIKNIMRWPGKVKQSNVYNVSIHTVHTAYTHTANRCLQLWMKKKEFKNSVWQIWDGTNDCMVYGQFIKSLQSQIREWIDVRKNRRKKTRTRAYNMYVSKREFMTYKMVWQKRDDNNNKPSNNNYKKNKSNNHTVRMPPRSCWETESLANGFVSLTSVFR